jgi:hypothetical protein
MTDKPRTQCVGYPECDGDLVAEPHSPGCPLYKGEPAAEAIPTDQSARDRYLAERYITREEHNNIIHMNEIVHERDVAERVREALQEVAPIVEFYLKREIESPSNHQEFAREAQEKLNRFRAAARAPIVTKEQLGIVTDDEGNDHWGIQPQPGAPEDGK